MRSSKSRSRSKSNRQRSIGNIINRVFESSGPEGKVRGTPQQIIEKYLGLARDAQLSNDRVAEQNFLQHAEHYTRLLHEAQREMAQRQNNNQGNGNQNNGNQSNGNDGQDGNGQPNVQQNGNAENRQPEVSDADANGQSDNGNWRKRESAPESDTTEGDDSNLVETPESRSEPRSNRRPPRAVETVVSDAADLPVEAPKSAQPESAEEAPAEAPVAEEKPKRARKPRAKKPDTAEGEKPKATRNRRKPKAAEDATADGENPVEDASKAAS